MAEGTDLGQACTWPFIWVWAVLVETHRWTSLDLGITGLPVSEEHGVGSFLTLEA